MKGFQHILGIPKIVSMLGIVLLALACTKNTPSLSVAPIFSDQMVLQQNSAVTLWGTGAPGALIQIEASWGETAQTEIDAQGRWEASLQTTTYGGPHQLVVTSAEQKIQFDDVLLGEVWLASGQSNMEWPMIARIDNQKEEIQTANYPNIRYFNVPKNLNSNEIKGRQWKAVNPESVQSMSAVGYFFARQIHEELDVPVGIIVSAWGGTRVEAWTSIEKLVNMPPSSEEASEIKAAGDIWGYLQMLQQKNESIVQANEAYLEAKSFAMPEDLLQWESLEMDDLHYAAEDFDDSQWATIDWPGTATDYFNFEDLFQSGSYAEDGVIWFRTSFDLDDPNDTYRLTVELGIDDYDYTYLNGTHIGTTLSCCIGRSYTIPAGVLKKENNVLALRVIDIVGEGGFRSNLYLESDSKKIQLDRGEWRYNHHAFFLDTNFQLHSLDLETLTQNDSLLKQHVKRGEGNKDPNRYSILYETMIKPLVPYKIKGVLWYQGESNVPNYDEYQTLFSGMIADWRQRWKEDFPVYYVQIAPYQYDENRISQALREAQRKTLVVNNTGMAITLDVGEEKDIHPANKQAVGHRLARLALANDYGQDELVPTGPLYKSHKTFRDYLEISFDHIGSGLSARGALTGFEVATETGPFVTATAKIIGTKVRVSTPTIKNPKRVRYAWKNYVEATLFNKEGLPASSFSSEE
jgi:sialate O-acetylesterase